jgi:hypothetical protein
MPMVAWAEFAVNEVYHGFDFYLSYTRLAEAHKVNGRVMDSARYIQKNIDETYLALEGCW